MNNAATAAAAVVRHYRRFNTDVAADNSCRGLRMCVCFPFDSLQLRSNINLDDFINKLVRLILLSLFLFHI